MGHAVEIDRLAEHAEPVAAEVGDAPFHLDVVIHVVEADIEARQMMPSGKVASSGNLIKAPLSEMVDNLDLEDVFADKQMCGRVENDAGMKATFGAVMAISARAHLPCMLPQSSL